MENDDVLSLAWNTHQTVLMSDFESLLQSETLVDCTLAAEGQRVKAHKIIISACSPYLKMLLSEHTESHPIIILNETSFEDLKYMLEYMYKGVVSLKKKDLPRFVRSAEALQIRGLANHGMGVKSISDESEYGNSLKKKLQSIVDNETALNDDLSQNGDRDANDEGLIVPKIENQSDDERPDENDYEEVELTEVQAEISELGEQIIEDQCEQQWEPEASGSELHETVYTENNEGNQESSVKKLKTNKRKMTNNNEDFKVKHTKLPENYSWFDEDFSYSRDAEPSNSVTEDNSVKQYLDKSKVKNQARQTLVVSDEAKELHKCELCPAIFHKMSSLNSHKTKTHEGSSKPRAVNQNSLVVNPNQLARYRCPFCTGRFTKIGSMKQHVTRKHLIDEVNKSAPNKRSFQCSLCTCMFHQTETFALHLATTHFDRDMRQENSCDNNNTDNDNDHGSISFSCETCNISFPNLIELKKHKVSAHPSNSGSSSQLPLFYCRECNVIYSGPHPNCKTTKQPLLLGTVHTASKSNESKDNSEQPKEKM